MQNFKLINKSSYGVAQTYNINLKKKKVFLLHLYNKLIPWSYPKIDVCVYLCTYESKFWSKFTNSKNKWKLSKLIN